MIFENIIQIVIAGGLSSLLTFFLTLKSMRKKSEAEAMQAMQQVYDNMARHTKAQMDEMREDYKRLRNEFEQYKQKCQSCRNHNQ